MHYRFQNILKFSKCFFKMFSTHFKHKNSPMVWTMLKTVLMTMSNISKCVENHIENFKAWVVLQKKAWRNHDVTFWKHIFTELIQLKYKLILWIKTMGCCGLACVVWLKSCEFSKRKSVLIVGNSSMMCLLWKFLNLTHLWTFFIFYQTEWTCWVFLLPVRSQEHLKEIKAFEAAIWYLGRPIVYL